MQNPDWRAQRHRQGRRFCESRRVQPNFFVRNSAGISPWRPTPPPGGRPVPLGTRKLAFAQISPLAPAEKQALTERPHSCHSHLASRRQRKELRAPTSSSPRRGWRWLAHSVGVQLLYFPPNTRAPNPRNFSAQRSPSARLGEILLFQLFVETEYFPLKAWRAHPPGVLLACR